MEAEAHGDGETLARHEKLLLELAKKRNYNVTQIYREVVSGETIAARPVMQHLNTLIITPLKVYDPNNEFDEEYFEFGLFMSRREYKTINRRLQRGRVASSKEGKYAGGRRPYGYERVRIQNYKGWTLKPIDEETDIVRLIFKLYTEGQEQPDGSYRPVGCRVIGNTLDNMGVAPPFTASYWTESTIRNILRNPVYIGKIRWNTKKRKKRVRDGVVSYERTAPPPEELFLVDGLHSPIITPEVFYKAQEILGWRGSAPVHKRAELQNPFAGLLYCGKCGRAITLRTIRNPMLLCPNKTCNNVMSKAEIVEERILQALRQWLDSYRLELQTGSTPTDEEIQIDIKRKAITGVSI